MTRRPRSSLRRRQVEGGEGIAASQDPAGVVVVLVVAVTGSDLRVHFDSSELIKRSVQEAESDAVEAAFDRYAAEDSVIISSSLAWVEVSRALRTRLDGALDGEAVVYDDRLIEACRSNGLATATPGHF